MSDENPVVNLCVDGMRAEAEGRADDARRLFLRAWELGRNDYDACIAAHYLARQQKSPEETLRWNRESLARANAVNDERVREFYPSLYLNMGKAYEDVGDRQEARRNYELAAERVKVLPEGRYRDVVQDGITRGLERTRES